jgi:hypothetical protein
MNSARPFRFILPALVALGFNACSDVKITHVRPGQSASAALAKGKQAQQPPVDPAAPSEMPVAAVPPGQPPLDTLPPLPAGAVNVPGANGSGNAIAEAYSRGTFAMQAGQNAEAIAAFEQTVKLDPEFTDAWGKLAILYQKGGNSAKATEAFKKAKRLGDPNGGTVSRDSSSGLQLP